MKKGQIYLFSDQQAKIIVQKNSHQDNEHAKVCKNLEVAKHEVKICYEKTRRELGKRLERHVQDSLSLEEIKRLHKFVGNETEEEEFCLPHRFESCRRRSSSLLATTLSDSQEQAVSSSSDQFPFKTSSSAKTKDLEKLRKPNTCGTNQATVSRQNKLLHYRRDDDHGWLANTDKVHKVHHQTCQEDITNASNQSQQTVHRGRCKKNSDALCDSNTALPSTRESISKNISKNTETRDDNCDKLSVWSEEHLIDRGEKMMKTERNMNNDNKLHSISHVEEGALDKHGHDEITERPCDNYDTRNETICVFKRLGPTPHEHDEDCEDRLNTNAAEQSSETNYTEQSGPPSCVQGDNIFMFTKASRLKRRSSWSGPNLTLTGQQMLMRKHSTRKFPPVEPQFDPGNNTTATQPRKCEDMCRSSLSLKETGRHKMYTEKPFYIRSRRLPARRFSWQSTQQDTQTQQDRQTEKDSLQKSQEIATAKTSEEGDSLDGPQAPVVKVLPPIMLQTIYAQQSSKQKREHEHKETSRKGVSQRAAQHSVDTGQLTHRLHDCRYLRHPVRR